MSSKMAAMHKELVIKALYFSAGGYGLFSFQTSTELIYSHNGGLLLKNIFVGEDDSEHLSNAGKARIYTIITPIRLVISCFTTI